MSKSEKFTQLYNSIMDGLSPNEKLLYYAIKSYLYGNKRSKTQKTEFYASKKSLAEKAGVSEKTVQRLLKAWRIKGWLIAIKANRFKPVVYRLDEDRMLIEIGRSQIPTSNNLGRSAEEIGGTGSPIGRSAEKVGRSDSPLGRSGSPMNNININNINNKSIISTNNINTESTIANNTSSVPSEPVGSESDEAALLNKNTVTDNHFNLEDDINVEDNVSVTDEYQRFLDISPKEDILKRRDADPGFSTWLITRLEHVKSPLCLY